jgi:ABC-type dipeptide/oligopeptide/nickel transport system permease subunit
VLAFNVIGDGLREYLDPRQIRRVCVSDFSL